MMYRPKNASTPKCVPGDWMPAQPLNLHGELFAAFSISARGASDKRPCDRRAAEQRDEIAPLHVEHVACRKSPCAELALWSYWTGLAVQIAQFERHHPVTSRVRLAIPSDQRPRVAAYHR
jgi:hypothetical protein